MDKLNSIEKAKYISNEYKEYLKSSFSFKNEKYQEYFEKELDKENLFKGPYLSLTLPFVKGKTLNELINNGEICKDFRLLKSLDLNRKLYLHQEKSISRINKGRSVVITTGTGSGKTECFLYPVINGIMQNIQDGNTEQGIRALFLYPMNALVNDQIERIRKILRDYPNITYAYFTGDTPEKITPNERKTKSDENPDNPIPENELLSREEIRNNIPHILFTNYSMLEYLMIRPSDQTIFNNKTLNNWKYIILDEAHSYTGTKAIELSLLLRRVTGMSNRKQQYILTSATLGEKGKSEADILAFANRLTNAEYNIDDVIFSDRIKFNYDIDYQLTADEIIEMHADKKKINDVCVKYGVALSNDEKANLYELLQHDKSVHSLYKVLENKNELFFRVYEKLNHLLTEEALIKLIDLINYSVKDGLSVYDLKYHSFVKALSGIYMSFNNNASLTLTKTKAINDCKAHEIGNCRFCNSSFIVGKEITNRLTGLKYLIQNDEVDIYENYGDSDVYLDYYLVGVDSKEGLSIEDRLVEHECCVKCGNIYAVENPNALKCDCGTPVFKLFKVENSNNGTKSNNIGDCPCCGRSSNSGIVRTLNLGKDEGTALISQILYRSMEKTFVGSGNAQKKISLLGKNKKEPTEEKNEVKQYLAFSDSRQQASFFAIFLNHSNTRFLQKRLIWEVIKNNNFNNNIPINDVVSSIIKMVKDYRLFDNDLGDTKNAWAAVLVELLKVDGNYGGEGLGLFNFAVDLREVMSQLEEEDIREVFGKYGMDKAMLEKLMQICLASFRRVPAIDITKSTLTPEDRKEVLEYRRFDNWVVLKKPEKSSEKDVYSFLPVKGAKGIVKYVSKVLNCTDQDSEQVLGIIFSNILAEAILKKNLLKICIS